ncbi:MAG: cytochrome c oxidase subunit 3 family protein, partial [Actinomycetota bacterium]
MGVEAAVLPGMAVPERRRIPGNKGIWVGISCEMVEFTVMFVIYFVARAH